MKKSKIGAIIIASAIIWAAVIISSSSVLKETPFKDTLGFILMGGTIAHLLFVWAPLGRELKARNYIDQEEMNK